MLSTRSLIALFVTYFVSSVSVAQTSVVEPDASVLAEANSTEIATVVISGTESIPPVQPSEATSALPAPLVPVDDATVQVETPVQSSVMISTTGHQSKASAYSPQRDGLPTLEQRRQLRAMPIEQRPNRRFHFYGNTVRRRMGR